MKNGLKIFVLVLILAMIPINVYAAVVPGDDNVEPESNKHYHVRELYREVGQAMLYPAGEGELDALRKVWREYEKQYKIYQVLIGNENVRHFLYDEYETRWTGYWRLTPDSYWHVDPMYDDVIQITRDHDPFATFLFEMPGL